MNQLKIALNFDAFTRSLTALETRQLPFAIVRATNETAFKVRTAWMEESKRVFDRPTPLTQRAAQWDRATKAKPYAVIKLRDEASKGRPPAKYLLAEVLGGKRVAKGFELRLREAGIMADSEFAVPGKGVRLDGYGNIRGGDLTAMLAASRALRDSRQNKPRNAFRVAGDTRRKYERNVMQTRATFKTRRKRAAKADYFAIHIAGKRLKPGVYQRMTTAFGSAIRPALVFVKQPSYRARYDIFKYAGKTYNRYFPTILRNELGKAVASATARGWA